jgi:hypothetical protein
MMGMEKIILDRISFGGVKDLEDYIKVKINIPHKQSYLLYFINQNTCNICNIPILTTVNIYITVSI